MMTTIKKTMTQMEIIRNNWISTLIRRVRPAMNKLSCNPPTNRDFYFSNDLHNGKFILNQQLVQPNKTKVAFVQKLRTSSSQNRFCTQPWTVAKTA